MKIYLVPVVVLSLLITARAELPVVPSGPLSPDTVITDKTIPDVDRQQGVWMPIAAIIGGAYLPPPALKATTLSIKGMNYEVAVAGEDHADKGTFTLERMQFNRSGIRSA